MATKLTKTAFYKAVESYAKEHLVSFSNFNVDLPLMAGNGFSEEQVWDLISDLEYTFNRSIPLFVDEHLSAPMMLDALLG